MKSIADLVFHFNFPVLLHSQIVFPFEKYLTDDLKTYGLIYLSAITYLNITKIVHPINSKNLPGDLYATTAPGF